MDIIKISRPRFWLYLAGPFLLGTVYALNNFSEINLFIIYSFFFFLIPANIYLYGINDLFDRDTDQFNVKKSSKEHRLINNEIKKLIFWLILSFILFVPLLIFSSFNAKIILIIWFLLSTFYSGFIRFKAIPFLDFMSNILYIMPALYAYYIVTNSLPHYLFIVAFFVWAWAMHLYSAIPDIKADKKANVETTATFIGEKLSLLLCFIFWFIFSIILSIKIFPFGLITIIYPLLIIYTYFNIKKINEIYWIYPYVNAMMGFMGFIHATIFY